MAYRVADIGALAEREFGVRDSLSGMRKLLHGLGLSWLQPRPRHPASDAEAQAEFKKKPPRMVAEVAAAHPEATSIELWFQDETRIGQKGALTRLWGRRGPAAPGQARSRLRLRLSLRRRLSRARQRRRHYGYPFSWQ